MRRRWGEGDYRDIKNRIAFPRCSTSQYWAIVGLLDHLVQKIEFTLRHNAYRDRFSLL